jgi:hypothetical protein
MVFSKRSDLGEDLRLVHKGRVLKENLTLKAQGVATGDKVAVARKNSTATTVGVTPLLPAASEADRPTKVARVEDNSDAATTHVEAIAPDATLAAALGSASTAADSGSASAAAMPAEDQDNEAGAAAASPELAQAVAEEPDDHTAAPKSPMSTAAPEAIDCSSQSGLLNLAKKVDESGYNALPPPEQLAKALREAAMRMAVLEQGMQQFGQALQVVNHISATVLRSSQGNSNGENGDSNEDSFPLRRQESNSSESERSFMHKRGDAETQELHQRASLARATSASVSASGTTGGTTPVSKEEMEKARKARLDALEAQQRDKKKEKEEADEKGKAREAMFNRPFAGAAKP